MDKFWSLEIKNPLQTLKSLAFLLAFSHRLLKRCFKLWITNNSRVWHQGLSPSLTSFQSVTTTWFCVDLWYKSRFSLSLHSNDCDLHRFIAANYCHCQGTHRIFYSVAMVQPVWKTWQSPFSCFFAQSVYVLICLRA